MREGRYRVDRQGKEQVELHPPSLQPAAPPLGEEDEAEDGADHQQVADQPLGETGEVCHDNPEQKSY